MRLLSDAGVRTYAFIGPIYPTATSNGLRELVRKVSEAGASYAMVDGLNLRSGVWLSVVRALSSDDGLLSTARARLFPGQEGRPFYEHAFRLVEEEARALDLPVSRA